jgi:hypothetical protein
VITLLLGRNDLNALKQARLLASTSSFTSLYFDASFIADMHQNLVTPIPAHSMLPVDEYIPDASAPTLENFDIDLEAGILHLEFDEAINIGSFDVTKVSIENDVGVAPFSIPLSEASTFDAGVLVEASDLIMANSKDGPIVSITLPKLTVDRIKARQDVLRGSGTGNGISASGRVRVDPGCVSDLALPEVENSMTYATVREIVPDVSPPTLEAFSVDLLAGTILLVFDEPVDPASVNLTRATAAADAAGAHARLLATQVDVTTWSYHDTHSDESQHDWGETIYGIRVNLTDDDLLALQRSPDLFTDRPTSFISFVAGFVNDAAFPPNSMSARVSGVSAASYLYYDLPQIQLLGPDAGVALGGTGVTVFGRGFVQAEKRSSARASGILPVECRINGFQLPCSASADDELTFTSPAATDIGVNAGDSVSLSIVLDDAPPLSVVLNAAYTFLPEPVLESIKPTHGSQLGGTTITLSGQNFGRDTETGAGANVGALVNNQPCTNCSVIGGSLVCDTSSLPLGDIDGDALTVDVTVDIDGATSTLVDAYTFLPAPTSLSVLPPSGYAGEPVELTFTGTNFGPTTASGVAPPTRVMVGDVECTEVAVLSDAELTCTVVPALTGAVDAVVYVDRRPASSERTADGLEFSGFGDRALSNGRRRCTRPKSPPVLWRLRSDGPQRLCTRPRPLCTFRPRTATAKRERYRRTR